MTTPMLQHADVWRGIDRLASKNGLSASGLARRAGLDPTAFNPSKRITREGRPRWPSTESISKILTVTGESFAGFVSLTGLIEAANGNAHPAGVNGGPQSGPQGFAQPASGGRIGRPGAERNLPVIALDRLAAGDCFSNDGRPQGNAWGRLDFAGAAGKEAFAIEINGQDFEPVYRDADTIVASPTTEVRRGDRVVIGTSGGTVMIRKVGRSESDGLHLEAIARASESQFVARDQIRFIARILWVSQ